jgi:glutamate racemase
MKREQLFVQLLEGLYKDEAEMLVLACNKDLQAKYRVTKAVVQEAFPSIEWGNRG